MYFFFNLDLFPLCVLHIKLKSLPKPKILVNYIILYNITSITSNNFHSIMKEQQLKICYL